MQPSTQRLQAPTSAHLFHFPVDGDSGSERDGSEELDDFVGRMVDRGKVRLGDTPSSTPTSSSGSESSGDSSGDDADIDGAAVLALRWKLLWTRLKLLKASKISRHMRNRC